MAASRSKPVRSQSRFLPLALAAGFILLVGVGAFNSQNNLLFLLFGLSIGAVVISGIVSGMMMMRLRVRRSPGATGTAGRPMRLDYEVAHAGRWFPGFAVTIEEHAARGRAGADWTRFLSAPPRAFLEHVPCRGSAPASAVFTPRRRGEMRLTGVRLVSRFPFGIVTKSVLHPQPARLLVHPAIVPLKRRALAGLFADFEIGGASARAGGRGEEFYGLRDYAPGDSPRLIAWRSSARTGELVVREHGGGASRRLWILLNLPPRSPGRAAEEQEASEEAAISLAASLADAALRAGLRVGLSAAAHGILVPPGGSPRQRSAMLESLARLDAGSPPAPGTGAAPAITRRDSVIVVHAGAIDPSAGPPRAMHLSSDSLAELAEPAGAGAALGTEGDAGAGGGA